MRCGMQFRPDKPADSSAAQMLNGRLSHMAQTQSSATTPQAPGLDAESADPSDACGLEPPTPDMPLPGARWFAKLSWDSLRNIRGDTFVQVPRRLEYAFCEAIGVTLHEIVGPGHSQERVSTGWKAFLVLSWLFFLLCNILFLALLRM